MITKDKPFGDHSCIANNLILADFFPACNSQLANNLELVSGGAA
ncbi:hypothetical protein [Nostoc sp.]|nr:hypothetical protein [Nostoc sp.]